MKRHTNTINTIFRFALIFSQFWFWFFFSYSSQISRIIIELEYMAPFTCLSIGTQPNLAWNRQMPMPFLFLCLYSIFETKKLEITHQFPVSCRIQANSTIIIIIIISVIFCLFIYNVYLFFINEKVSWKNNILR